MRRLLLILLAIVPAFATEQAAYDSNGRVISLIAGAEDFPVSTSVVAVLPNGKRVPLQIRRGQSGAQRRGEALAWSSPFTLPDGGRGRMDLSSVEDPSGVHYSAMVSAEGDLNVSSIEFVVDAPRPVFLNGSAIVDLHGPIAIPLEQPPGSAFFRGETTALSLTDQANTRTLKISFDHAHAAALVDRWDAEGRFLEVRARLGEAGKWNPGAMAGLTTTLRLTDTASAPPAHLTMDASKSRYRFQGFGGNYCWDNRSPVATYTMKNLKIAWARTAMKLVQWDQEHNNPGAELRADFDTMRTLQRRAIPYVLSVWSAPERFYTDAYEKPASSPSRVIDPLKWDELLDLMTSYLQYARREYGVEPDLFSFNESNIGINIGMTPEANAAAIKRIGVHFQAAGLKTRMLLGDAAGPRDTHKFALEAASDANALPLIGAVGFHSWGGGTPAQYSAWGDLAQWLHLPLLVTEVGVDASAYHTHAWDSYDYGLKEARMIQELLAYARPQALLFWQFTDDYALARVGPDGSVSPSARFSIVKHFADLIPRDSDALTASSDRPDVLFTAFRNGDAYSLEILNTGAARAVTLAGIPNAEWQITQTSESAPYQQQPAVRSQAAALELNVPARSLITLTARSQTSAN
jgi:hypothetical protein